MLSYEENMIRDIKFALHTAMRRRKQYCIEWEDAHGTEREFIVFAEDDRDAVGQLFYKLARIPDWGKGVRGVRVTNVGFINYVDDSGRMIPASDRIEFEKQNPFCFTWPFATKKLKKVICDFIDRQIMQSKEED